MSQSLTQNFLVVPAQGSVGLTSVTLGLVRAMQRLGVGVGFAKPIAQDEADNSVQFAREIFHLDSPEPLTMQEAGERIAYNQTEELLEEILALCMNVGSENKLLFIEGLHSDTLHTFAFPAQLNVDIARSLKAELVIVTDASTPNAASNLRLIIRKYGNEGCKIAGVVFNKVPEDFDKEEAARLLGDTPIWGFVHENPALRAPRTLDVAKHLGAEILLTGQIATRRVRETILAARSAAEFIPRLVPGVLVITPGDRNDIILASSLAASRGIELAGLLLTHSSSIAPHVMDLAAPTLNASGLPIIRTGGDSYETARRVSRIPSAVPVDDLARMNAVLDTVAEDLDVRTISSSFHTPEINKLSPAAFRYQLIQKARQDQKRIVLPEGDELRTIKAAIICEKKGIARCVLLGKREVIENVATSQGLVLPDNIEIIDPDSIRERYADPMVALRKAKGLTRGHALAQLEDPVVLGTMMLAVGEVDGLVSGAIHTTANTLRPALQLIKTAPGSSLVSSVFFMLMPDQVLVYGDCALNPAPTAEQLAEIARQSADSAEAFGIPPKVAMISYSTGTSGAGQDVDKVRMATEIAHRNFPDLLLDGPLQYDAASVMEVGRQKAPDSPVAGQATVFVFPDLNTGNTTYKAVQRSANVVSAGPMLQGLRKPVNDLSRGALVDDIVFTITLTVIQAQSAPLQSEPAI